MSRNKYSILGAAFIDNLKSLFRVFRNQNLSVALILAVMILLLSLFFTFMAFTPVLSPFIYPLL